MFVYMFCAGFRTIILLFGYVCSSTKGNYQASGTFWRRVSVNFHGLMNHPPGTRNQDALQSEWRKLRIAVQKFNEIFTRLSSNHQSGSNDADIIKRALKEFKVGRPAFAYLDEWVFLKQSSKFDLVLDIDLLGTRGRSSAKRLKSNSGSPSGWSSGSDARVHIDLNETDEDSTEETRVHRVIGRDASKRAACAGSSGSIGMSQFGEEFARMGSSLTDLVDVGKKRVEQNEKKLEMKARKQYAEDMKQLLIDPATVPVANRRAVEEVQRQIRERYES